jgi:hypothetical protein
MVSPIAKFNKNFFVVNIALDKDLDLKLFLFPNSIQFTSEAAQNGEICQADWRKIVDNACIHTGSRKFI